ncbi:putative (R)-mandelonitrile lyase [Helianthus annuus]|uniref:(R)-mandelonitrile lyase n=1 Tax=Helianthus annuus TaxID=4232 RepID=A0A251TNB4_HELAN|nr:(R)-mandelonitrile lyase-like [Helianthus annuus]KAF5787888.1 putative (R)-mandelonitrile lyase [Helianthus annuus]
MASITTFTSTLILLLLLLMSLISSTSSQSPPYATFVINATELPPEDYFDYIIVGGGTAGCPLAATLSFNHRVLLLERGGVPYTNPNVMKQEGFIQTLRQIDNYYSPAQAFSSDEGVPNARGRILGGSSAINAGFYSRADDEFYNSSGINFDVNLIERSYQWIERAIVFEPELQPLQRALLDGLVEAGVRPWNGFSVKHVYGTKIGGSTFNSSGYRHSAADLLNLARESNIKVAVYATVERVLFTSSGSFGGTENATGVVVRDTAGHYHRVLLRKEGEVIVSAGAIGSPHLLLLSGIGPRSYLSSWGIPVVNDLEFVGEFLYDNPRNGISFLSPSLLEHSLIQVVGITESGAYLEASSTVRPYHPPVHSGFRRPHSAQWYFSVAHIMEKIVGPLSAGSLRLASTEITTNPAVSFNYFSNPVDLERCVNGTRKIADLLRTRAMSGFRFWNWPRGEFRFVGARLPVNQSSDEEMGEFCRRTVNTIWHYHGGCVVEKVVDSELRVIGVGSLRVIDGSVFSISPGTNPQATLLMLGRHMGLKILRGRLQKTRA